MRQQASENEQALKRELKQAKENELLLKRELHERMKSHVKKLKSSKPPSAKKPEALKFRTSLSGFKSIPVTPVQRSPFDIASKRKCPQFETKKPIMLSRNDTASRTRSTLSKLSMSKNSYVTNVLIGDRESQILQQSVQRLSKKIKGKP